MALLMAASAQTAPDFGGDFCTLGRGGRGRRMPCGGARLGRGEGGNYRHRLGGACWSWIVFVFGVGIVSCDSWRPDFGTNAGKRI